MIISDSELRKEFTKLRHSEEYARLLNISDNVTKQAIKDAVLRIRIFSSVCKNFQDSSPERDQSQK